MESIWVLPAPFKPNKPSGKSISQTEPKTKQIFKNRITTKSGHMTIEAFMSTARRFSDGECSAEEFLGACLEATGSREAMLDMFYGPTVQLPRLIVDPERQIALRRAMRRFLRGPDLFLVIGAMKCGTTSLYEYIVQHPNVMRANQKVRCVAACQLASVSVMRGGQ